MNNYPKVSICIPCFNSEFYIEACIASCLDQATQLPYEIIVCDDCSTDKSYDILQSNFAHCSNLRILQNSTNKGVGETRNTCILNSRGRYIFLLDSDDYIHPKCIDLLYSAIELCPSSSFVYSDYIYVDDNDQRSSQISALEKPIACAHLFKNLFL